MLPLEKKQSGGKLPPTRISVGECFYRRHHAAGNGKGTLF